MKIATRARFLFGTALCFLATACAAPGSLGDMLGLPTTGGGAQQQQGTLVVEILQVDPQQQAIQVRTQDGQTGVVRYDQRTTVVYRQQQYQVSALERGDIVQMQLVQTQGGELYVQHVEVQQSVQERQR